MHAYMKAAAAVLLLICLTAFPASAVIQETCIAGTVTKVTPSSGVIQIHAENLWGYDDLTWSGVSIDFGDYTDIDGTTEYCSGALSGISVGDTVQAAYLGDASAGSVKWIVIGKVSGTDPKGKFLTESFGDPSRLVAAFQNNFKIVFDTQADCTQCTGSTCAASSADMTVTQGWDGRNYPTDYTMVPGERRVFTSPEGCGQELLVTFNKGEAYSGACSSEPVIGPQPISDFTVSVITKGTAENFIPSKTIESSESAETAVSAQTPDVPAPTQKSSPGFAFAAAVLGILGAAAVRKF